MLAIYKVDDNIFKHRCLFCSGYFGYPNAEIKNGFVGLFTSTHSLTANIVSVQQNCLCDNSLK